MNNDELITAGFNINFKYEALVTLPFLVKSMTETVEQYYIRCNEVVQSLIKATESEGNTIKNTILTTFVFNYFVFVL